MIRYHGNTALGLILGTLILSLASTSAKAKDNSDLVTVTEVSRHGTPHTLGPAHIVDARSKITITFNNQAVQAAVAAQPGQKQLHSIIAEMNLLQDAAKRGLGALPKLQAAMAALQTDPQTPLAGEALASALTVFNVAGALTPEAQRTPEEQRLRTLLNAAITNATGQAITVNLPPKEKAIIAARIFTAVFNTAASEAANLQTQVNTLVSTMGPLKIDIGLYRNFSLQNQEPISTGGIFALGAADTAQLTAIGQFVQQHAGQSPGQAIAALLQPNLTNLQNMITTLNGQVSDCLQKLEQQAKADTDKLANIPSVKAVWTAATAVVSDATSIRTAITQLTAASGAVSTGSNPAGALSEFTSQAQGVVTSLNSLHTDLNTLKSSISALNIAQITDNDVKMAVMDLTTIATDCVSKLETTVVNTALQLPILGDALRAFGGLEGTMVQVSDDVLSRSLNALIPSDYDLEEHKALNRDQIIIKFSQTPTGQTMAAPIGSDYKIRVYYVDLYNVQTPLVIFAQPSKSSSYQLGASYSYLFRSGSRRSIEQDELINVGYGLNLAAFNFGGTSKVDLGIGGVLTGFNDYVQVGYGYDVSSNKGYFFFGLRLPLPASH